jgi:hypothetical protein
MMCRIILDRSKTTVCAWYRAKVRLRHATVVDDVARQTKVGALFVVCK